jgi:uncharacterized protein (DUF58 family)
VTRRATERLVVAAIATVTGCLLAVLGGLPEAAVLVAPWAALLVLGLPNARRHEPTTTVEISADRLVVDDEVEVITSVTGAAGSVHVRCRPGEGFWPHNAVGDERHSGARDVLVPDRTTVRCSLPAAQWGAHDVGHVQLEVTEPYGLFRREGVAGQRTVVRVHPTPTELQNLVAPWLVRRVTGAHTSKAVGRGVEFADIRPYTSGDSLRDINWRVSARHPELWVSQRHPDRATDVILLLDSFIESGHDVHTVVGFAIEAAVALAEGHLAVTDRVGLVDMGGIVRWVRPGTGRLQLQRLTDAMLSTGLYANASLRNLRGIPVHVLPPRSFVVALTPLLDERFIDALFVLRGRSHDVAVIECPSSGLNDADGRRSQSSELLQRLWRAERQMVRDRLADRGVAVASWHRGGHLEATLRELIRRRQRLMRANH